MRGILMLDFKLFEELMQGEEDRINRSLESADKFEDVAVLGGIEAFLELVDAVKLAVFWQVVDAVEVVALKPVRCGVFDDVPLDEVLGVVVFHILLIGAAKEVDDFGAD